MDFEEHNTKKRSLGALRKAPKTKPRSPDLVGSLLCNDTLWKSSESNLRKPGATKLLAV